MSLTPLDYTYKGDRYFPSLAYSLNRMPSSFIHSVTNGRLPLFSGWIIFRGVYILCLRSSFVDRHLGRFCILALVNNALVNVRVPPSLRDTGFFSFG